MEETNNKRLQKYLTVWIFALIFFMNFFSVSICLHKVHEVPANVLRPGAYWNIYLKDMQKQIRANWKSPAKSGKNLIISFDIAKDGKISNCKILQSSGKIDIDEKAMNAIKLSSPVQPLPKDFDGEYITVEYVFPIKKQPFDIIVTLFKLDGGFLERFIQKTEQKDKSSNNLRSNDEIGWSFYMKNLEKEIKNNWNPPKGNEGQRVIVKFKIDKDGRLLSCDIQQSSGNSEADAAAVEAVKITAPFKPLPKEFKGVSIDIEFTFDYNILRKNN